MSKKGKSYDYNCPKCGASLVVSVSREVLSDPVPGEYRDVVEVVLSTQTKLGSIK